MQDVQILKWTLDTLSNDKTGKQSSNNFCWVVYIVMKRCIGESSNQNTVQGSMWAHNPWKKKGFLYHQAFWINMRGLSAFFPCYHILILTSTCIDIHCAFLAQLPVVWKSCFLRRDERYAKKMYTVCWDTFSFIQKGAAPAVWMRFWFISQPYS